MAFITPCIMCVAPSEPVAERKSVRKPRGYWACDENLRTEIRLFTGSATLFPTRTELLNAKRRDLDNAISNAGGYKALAARLGLRSSAKRPRKPQGYWQQFANVRDEILRYVDEHAEEGNRSMPTLAELRAAGRSDLANAILRHGGVREVALRLDLLPASTKRQAGHWDGEEGLRALEGELRAYMRGGTREAFPRRAELRAAGRADLESAIAKHGGSEVLAGRLGVPLQRGEQRLHSFPAVAKAIYELSHQCGGRMPTSAEMRRLGRGELLDAVRRYGGLAAVAQRLSLPYLLRTRNALKDFARFDKELSLFIQQHGERGKMPSARLLTNYGRDDLQTAVLHHGGERTVSLRLGLKNGYLASFPAVAQQVLTFIDAHGVDGVMPTERDLLDLQRSALNVAVAKFGYRVLAERLGLKMAGGRTEVAIGSFVASALSDDDVEDDDDLIRADWCVGQMLRSGQEEGEGGGDVYQSATDAR